MTSRRWRWVRPMVTALALAHSSSAAADCLETDPALGRVSKCQLWRSATAHLSARRGLELEVQALKAQLEARTASVAADIQVGRYLETEPLFGDQAPDPVIGPGGWVLTGAVAVAVGLAVGLILGAQLSSAPSAR